jgi:hypothetical protein
VKLDPKIVAELAIQFQPKFYLRIMPRIHAATPLGMGFGQTRFASPDRSFRLLYAARDLATTIAETVVRDRFEGQTQRVLDRTEIEDWSVSEISAIAPLTLIDLRTTGLLKLGVSTDAARAKKQLEGRMLSQALHDRYAVDGVLYLSRLTGSECVAVYERAVAANKLAANSAVDLAREPNLVSSLRGLSIELLGPS